MARRKNTITLESSRWKLTTIWFVGGGIVVLLLIVLSIFSPRYGEDLEMLWGWVLPTIVPTLSLIITVLRAGAVNPTRDTNRVSLPFHRLTMALSIVYLSILTLTILVEPFARYDLVQLFSISNFWIAPMQGLVVAALTTLFFTDES